MTLPPFQDFPSIPRLSRDMVVTEKIDGENMHILIAEDSAPFMLDTGPVPFLVGSREQWIFPENDCNGFAKWAYDHAQELLQLGPGRHFGEWWGTGIKKRYETDRPHFSLFNVARWHHELGRDKDRVPPCCDVVPVLYTGPFSTVTVLAVMEQLRQTGSKVCPGCMRPEGVVVYHTAGRYLFKKTFERDEGKRKTS